MCLSLEVYIRTGISGFLLSCGRECVVRYEPRRTNKAHKSLKRCVIHFRVFIYSSLVTAWSGSNLMIFRGNGAN